MPALRNPRHERFAREYMRTGVQSKAYLKAGYQPGTRGSLDANASWLIRHPNVSRRIEELRRKMAQTTEVTLQSLLANLAEDRALARELGQVSAAVQANTVAAKLVGLLVDRKESGAPGDFASLQSADEVLELVRRELGDETARALAGVLGKHEAAQEVSHAAVEPTHEAGGTVN